MKQSALVFREDTIVARIEELAGIYKRSTASAPIQDHSLSTLEWVGYPKREKLNKRIIERLNTDDRQLYWLTMPVRRIAAPEFIPPIIQLFQAHQGKPYPYDSLLWVLADLALANPDASEDIWKAILAEATPEMTRLINGAGNVTSQFDIEHIIDYFLQQIDSDKDSATGINPRYYIYSRMQQLYCPATIDAFHRSLLRQDEKVSLAFHKDIASNTGQDTHWENDKLSIKRMACDIALRLKLNDIEEWLALALEETNVFLCLDIAKLAGYIRAEKAVPVLREIIRRKPRNVPLRASVLRSLGNIGTTEAFKGLFDSEVIVEESIPQALVNALAEAALRMANPEPLIDYIEGKQNKNMVLACAAALELVSSTAPALLKEFGARIFSCLQSDPEPASLKTGYLVGSLGFLNLHDISEDAPFLLVAIAEQGGQGGGRALEALARWDCLWNEPQLLEGMGLAKGKHGWYLKQGIDFRDAFVVGLLYTAHKKEFTRAVCDILEQDDFFVSVQVMWLLQNETPETVPSEIVDALVNRIRRQTERRRIESEALFALASCSPKKLSKEFNYSSCTDWVAPARIALASSLRNVREPEAINTLRSFLIDPLSDVRRIAANILSEKEQSTLREEVERLLSSEIVHDRRCGVEASSWLKEDQAFNNVIQKAQFDREQSVREAVRHTASERRERKWASDYLHKVNTPSDVREIWVYGQALLNIGDEFTAEKLKSLSHDINLPSNQRAWLEVLSEGVTKRWNDYVKNKEKG
jgi:HEAT repeat protein